MDKKVCKLDKDCVHFNSEQQCIYALGCRDEYIDNLEIALLWSGKYDHKTVKEFRDYLTMLKTGKVELP